MAPEKPKQFVGGAKCDCGKTHGQYLDHYQLLRASCGKIFWALQPRRGGPLKLFPWPGPNLTRQEMEDRA